MNRIEYIEKITKFASRFVLEVEGYNATNQYHINIHAESFLIPVLNEVFGLSLENLNSTQKKNYPAIDLADFKNRVAFQITATNTFEKIKHSLESFFKYDLQEEFDVLYFYIITKKKEKYNQDKLKDIIPNGFAFSVSDHIVDKNDLLQKINAISSTLKIGNIARLYEHEFSDIQIESRQKKYKGGYLNNESENIYPNVLNITIPKVLYKAELNIDERGISEKMNEYLVSKGKRRVKKFKKEKLIKQALREYRVRYEDWVLFENWLYSFRDLGNTKEPLSKIVDGGTVTEMVCEDFHETNDDYKNVFKHLLRRTFTEFCKTKGIEWFNRKKLYRFANDRKNPSEKKIRWKGKKEATRTVISEIRNKKEHHLICFRSLAFRCSFITIDKDWYIVINPTWSFTNPGGYYLSRFEPAYMSGIKKLENNNSVYNYFRIFGYYLSYSDLFTENYRFMKINNSQTLDISPKIEEDTWNPPKIVEKVEVDNDVELNYDNELFDNSFFD